MMNQLRAIIAAFIQQWKTTSTSATSLAFVIGAIPTVIVMAWVARQSGNTAVLAYIAVGVPLMVIWNSVIFNVGWSLNNELSLGTLQFTLISRTPMMAVLLGQTLARLAYMIPGGVVAVVTVLLMSFDLPVVAELGALLFSLLLVIVALTVTSLVFAPLLVLVGGKPGFFNAIVPFGVVLSGFLFPIDRLPIVLRVVARFLPTSWAMDGVWQSIRGPESWWLVAGAWAMCILLSAGLFGVAYLLSKIVENRVRVTGVLGVY